MKQRFSRIVKKNGRKFSVYVYIAKVEALEGQEGVQGAVDRALCLHVWHVPDIVEKQRLASQGLTADGIRRVDAIFRTPDYEQLIRRRHWWWRCRKDAARDIAQRLSPTRTLQHVQGMGHHLQLDESLPLHEAVEQTFRLLWRPQFGQSLNEGMVNRGSPAAGRDHGDMGDIVRQQLREMQRGRRAKRMPDDRERARKLSYCLSHSSSENLRRDFSHIVFRLTVPRQYDRPDTMPTEQLER